MDEKRPTPYAILAIQTTILFLQRPNQIKTHNVDYFKKSFFSSQFQLEYNYCLAPIVREYLPLPPKPHTQQEGRKKTKHQHIVSSYL
ncbi:MAG: hypothetical protein NTY00_03870 [Deltaproteobacteria bacterium]|nr:hypothetical protein [Deltaproteobacteria bacterium]